MENIIKDANPGTPKPGWVVVNGRGMVRRVVRIEPDRSGREGCFEVVYEALKPRRPKGDEELATLNRYRAREGMEQLHPYEHCVWFTSWRSWAGQGGGLGKATVLTDWSEEDATIPIVVTSDDLHEWRDLLDQAAKVLDDIDKQYKHEVNFDHPRLFAGGGLIGRVYLAIGRKLLNAGAHVKRSAPKD
jgi:hypothetical protein